MSTELSDLHILYRPVAAAHLDAIKKLVTAMEEGLALDDALATTNAMVAIHELTCPGEPRARVVVMAHLGGDQFARIMDDPDGKYQFSETVGETLSELEEFMHEHRLPLAEVLEPTMTDPRVQDWFMPAGPAGAVPLDDELIGHLPPEMREWVDAAKAAGAQIQVMRTGREGDASADYQPGGYL